MSTKQNKQELVFSFYLSCPCICNILLFFHLSVLCFSISFRPVNPHALQSQCLALHYGRSVRLCSFRLWWGLCLWHNIGWITVITHFLLLDLPLSLLCFKKARLSFVVSCFVECQCTRSFNCFILDTSLIYCMGDKDISGGVMFIWCTFTYSS